MTLFFDDDAPRKPHHAVERPTRRVALIGRMARFALSPQPAPPDGLGWIIPFFTRPA